MHMCTAVFRDKTSIDESSIVGVGGKGKEDTDARVGMSSSGDAQPPRKSKNQYKMKKHGVKVL